MVKGKELAFPSKGAKMEKRFEVLRAEVSGDTGGYFDLQVYDHLKERSFCLHVMHNGVHDSRISVRGNVTEGREELGRTSYNFFRGDIDMDY